jgi:hypothetical protein
VASGIGAAPGLVGVVVDRRAWALGAATVGAAWRAPANASAAEALVAVRSLGLAPPPEPPRLVWADAAPPAPALHARAFAVASASLCGAELADVSDPLRLLWAVSDPLSACLSLADELFARVAAWTAHAVTCDARNSTGLPCRLRTADAPLPVLWLRLRVGGPLVALPLADLVLPAANGSLPALCLVPGAPGGESHAAPMALGALTLRALAPVVDERSGRVALLAERARDAPTSDDASSCPPRRVCGRHATYLPAANACRPPTCNWWGLRVAVDGDTCELNQDILVLVATLSAVLAVGDGVLWLWRRRTLRRAAALASMATHERGAAGGAGAADANALYTAMLGLAAASGSGAAPASASADGAGLAPAAVARLVHRLRHEGEVDGGGDIRAGGSGHGDDASDRAVEARLVQWSAMPSDGTAPAGVWAQTQVPGYALWARVRAAAVLQWHGQFPS